MEIMTKTLNLEFKLPLQSAAERAPLEAVTPTLPAIFGHRKQDNVPVSD